MLYERLTFRHLKIERSGEILEQFQEFLKVFVCLFKKIGNTINLFKTVLRNDYEISVKKLMKFQSHIGKIEEYQGRTFFCSELVASAYKVIKVLNGNISAAQYWPGFLYNLFLIFEIIFLKKFKVPFQKQINHYR